MKEFRFTFFVFFGMLLLSFSIQRDPHLIVGDYKCNNTIKVTSYCGNEFELRKWYFSSDEFTSKISLLKNDEECEIHLAYKIYEKEEELIEEGFDYPVILFKNPERKNFMLVFTIRELKKSGLILHYEEDFSSKDVNFQPVDILLERIAGPAENME